GAADIQSLIVANNLDPDGPENYGATPEGQLKYMKEYFRAMYNTGVVEGISYWDPIAIDVKGAGWVVGETSAVEDTSFFDY
ncbi:glycosyl hydrolase 53 family protein, partial [Klebsiella pneumoniae]